MEELIRFSKLFGVTSGNRIHQSNMPMIFTENDLCTVDIVKKI